MFRLQSGTDAECVLFQRLAEGSFAGGGRAAHRTRQGIYAVAPSGRLLGALNSLDPERVAGVLEEALDAWAALPEEDRRLAPDVAERVALAPWGGVDRFESSYPRDGLVLRATFRDLPEGLPEQEPGAPALPDPPATPDDRGLWNLDFAWFRADELAALVPPDLEPGATHRVPPALVERLVRFHLVDSVRGQTWAFDARDVERAELLVRAVSRDDGRLEVRLEGRTRAVSRRPWRTYGGKPRPAGTQHERGVVTRLSGAATLDTAAGRFERFDLLALGERWGGSAFNGRRDGAASPFAVAFRRARPVAAERVAPAFLALYGWPGVSGGGCAPLEPDADD